MGITIYGDGSITSSGNLSVSATSNVVTTSPAVGGFIVPVGTTAQRVATQGIIRYNTTIASFETYNGTAWANVLSSAVVTPTAISGQNNTATSYMAMPKGTTAERPAGLTDGYIRFNSSLNQLETYFTNTASWTTIVAANGYSSTYLVQYVLIAGGGGGGCTYAGGGGGAGGVTTGNSSITSGTTYSIIVGAGGAGSVYGGTGYGYNGANTTFNTVVAVGGGGGGEWSTGGQPGGSGGGGGPRYPTEFPGGNGTTGQGTAGGYGYRSSNLYMSSGGGGGATVAGINASGQQSGGGGNGISYSVSGIATYYAGGGGAGGCYYAPFQSYAGGGGVGGGGPGGQAVQGTPGTNASGGGGGGAGATTGNSYPPGGAGGSGVVFLTYPGLPRATGGITTINVASNTTTHQFVSSGLFTA
jgi:hypothetical protein